MTAALRRAVEAPASTVADHRQFYADLLVAGARSTDERLRAAFASIGRECFLGPGPWSVLVESRYIRTPSDDPRLLYQDIVVAIDVARGINNGQPTLHASALTACGVRSGDTVLHIGAGTGYYTAVLAALAGDDGHVIAFEIEPDLAERARVNLAPLRTVSVVAGSGCDAPLAAADAIYVCAGATHPPASWLDALKPGGRLVFPLTPNEGFGVMMCITRTGERRYAASIVMPVTFIPCIGARDAESSRAVADAVRTGSIAAVRSLRRDLPADATACCVGGDWWLSSADPR